jgi:hypothetical protein
LFYLPKSTAFPQTTTPGSRGRFYTRNAARLFPPRRGSTRRLCGVALAHPKRPWSWSTRTGTRVAKTLLPTCFTSPRAKSCTTPLVSGSCWTRTRRRRRNRASVSFSGTTKPSRAWRCTRTGSGWRAGRRVRVAFPKSNYLPVCRYETDTFFSFS